MQSTVEEAKSLFRELMSCSGEPDINKSKIYVLNGNNSTTADNSFKVPIVEPIDGIIAYSVLYASVEKVSASTTDILISCDQLSSGTGSYINTSGGYATGSIIAIARGATSTTRFICDKTSNTTVPLPGPTKLNSVKLTFFDDQGVTLGSAAISKFSLVIRLFFQ